MTLLIIFSALILLTLPAKILFKRWLIPPSEHEYTIKITPRDSTSYPWNYYVCKDGKRVSKYSAYGTTAYIWQAKFAGYLGRRQCIKKEKLAAKVADAGEINVVVPPRSSAKSAVVKSTDYTRLKEKYSKNQLSQEEFEREIGKLLIEEEKEA